MSPTAEPVVVRTGALPTVADTRALGRQLGARLGPGDLVVLTGPLGAGKTCLAAGIGEGLGVEGPVTSPTFVIAREHPSRPDGRGVTLVHVDAYRLGAGLGGDTDRIVAELDDIDLDTDLTRAAVVVEWGEGVAEHLVPDRLLVRLDRPHAANPDDASPDDANRSAANPDPSDTDPSNTDPSNTDPSNTASPGTDAEQRTVQLSGPARLVDGLVVPESG